MTPAEAWTPPDFSDLAALARALAMAAPEAEPVAPLRVLGEGFFSVAVVTASGFVFRLGTAPGVMARYRKEWRLLPWLSGRGLPVALPEPRWLLEPSEALPFGGLGYALLPGVPMMPDVVARGDRARLIEDMATFILALHRTPLEDLAHLDLPGREAHAEWRRLDHEAAMAALPSLLTTSEMRHVEAWWEAALEEAAQDEVAPVLTHQDIGNENLLVAEDGSRLLGVIDWEHAGIADPAFDFDEARYLGAAFQRELLEAYQRLGGTVDTGMDARLQRRWEHGPFPRVRRAWLRGDPIDGEQVRASLRRHGILDGIEGSAG